MHPESIRLDAEVESLLTEAQLPTSDLASTRNVRLWGMREGGRLVAVVGMEVYGGVALLRSLAVEQAHRNRGLGVALVCSCETWAANHGVHTLCLLTTSAAEFFSRLGYEVAPRSEAPASIAATAQFSALCPAASTFMRKGLSADKLRERAGPETLPSLN